MVVDVAARPLAPGNLHTTVQVPVVSVLTVALV